MKTICSLVTKAPNVLSVCLLAVLIGGATIVQAQSQDKDHVQLGAYFLTVVPRGEFSENLASNSYGGGFQGLVRIGSSPFMVGGDLALVIYGHERRLDPTISERVTTSNLILLPHFVLRAQPRSGLIRPYVEGLIGLKYLFTETDIPTGYDPIDDDYTETEINLSDTAFSYGVGGGLQISPTRDRESRFMLDLGVRWLRGGRAEYLREGSIRDVNGSVVYDVLSSRTDTLAVQVGVTYRF
jgi:opacity protein-like surface antigen